MKKLIGVSVIISAFTAVMISCDLKVPGVPIWTIEATIPLNERVYRLQELVTDSAKFLEQGWGLLVNDYDSVLKFVYTEELEYQQIGDRLTYEGSERGVYSNRIGEIHIEEPLPDGDTVTIEEANPDLFPGYEGPIPPFVLQEAQDTLEFDIFHWVKIKRGWMYLTILNEYPFDLEDVTLSMFNLQDNDLIGQVTFAQTIGQGESALDSINLSETLVRNRLIMQAYARTPGNESPVVVTGEENMAIIVNISETDVDSANAEVAEQRFSEPHSLEIDNPNRIVSTAIKTGMAHFRLTNTTRFRLFVNMVFENITDSEGNPLAQNIVMDPLSVGAVENIDLTGQTLTMSLDSQTLNVLNDVRVEDSRVTNFQDTSYQNITGYQGVDIEYWTSDLTLKSLHGILDSVRVDIPEQTTEVEIPEGLDSLDFTRDTLFVTIDNGTEMPLKLNFNVIGENSISGNWVEIPVDAELFPGENTIVVPDVDNLTEVLPDIIRVTGWAGLGTYFFPDYIDSTGSVSDEQGFSGRVRLKSGLKLSQGETRFITDVTEVEDSYEHTIQDVEVFIDLVSSIPMSGSVKLLMGNSPVVMDTLANIKIPRGVIQNHRSESVDTSFSIFLNTSQLEIMKQRPIFTKQILLLESSMGDTVWLHTQDSLAVKASATLHYLVDILEENNDE